MSHDHSYISKLLKKNKEQSIHDDREYSNEMAIDMEFPHADRRDEEENK